MKFVTVRELRSSTAALRKGLAVDKEVILTANGKPFAVVTPVSPDTLEEDLLALRLARLRRVIDRIRASAKAKGLDKMTMKEIDEVIAESRRDRAARARRRA